MALNVIERYIYDMLSARTTLADRGALARHHVASYIISDVLNYFNDHLEDVVSARRAIAVRGDPEDRRMIDVIDEFMSTHALAREDTNAAVARARDR